MKLRYFLCIFVLIHQIPSFAQIGGTGSASDPTLSLDAINERIRARKAQEARAQDEAVRAGEQERQKRERAERDYASKREAARVALRDLPDTPERQPRLDQFSCTFPPSAILQPTLQAVEECMSELGKSRERITRDAAAEQEMKAAQEQRAEQKRKDDEALRAAQERKADEDRKARAEALLAAQEAARQAALAESRGRIIFGLIAVLTVAGLATIVFYKRKQGLASVATALVMGFFSGFLLYFMAAMLFTGSTVLLTRTFVAVTFFGGWAISTHLLLKGAISASKVLARGFLLGAAEWFAMIPIGFYFAGKAVSETVTRAGGSDASQVGAVIGGGILASFSGVISVAMAVTCLIGYAITHFMTREMKPESTGSIKKCPECAETIQAAARKCRYCGAVLVDPHLDSAH